MARIRGRRERLCIDDLSNDEGRHRHRHHPPRHVLDDRNDDRLDDRLGDDRVCDTVTGGEDQREKREVVY